MKYLLPFIVLLIYTENIKAQHSLGIQYRASYEDKKLTLNHVYAYFDTSTIVFSKLRFYISNIQCKQKGAVVFSESNSYHLLDLSDEKSFFISIPNLFKLSFDEIQFDIGIDSTTNSSGALGGDLDPIHGMYWTWQNGYINLKLEGSCPQAASPTHVFEFHLGGYQSPYNSLQTIHLIVEKPHEPFYINFALNAWVKQIDFQKTHHVMSPSATSVFLSQLLQNCFSLKYK
ncbi:MAG: MbnP family protein [Chitinophagaceae bacterium]